MSFAQQDQTGHRPWPVPARPWALRQVWSELLFAHWPVDGRRLREHLPRGPLELDTFDGTAWLGVVPFRMEGVRLRGLPPVPGTRSFLELNVRTYVRHGERPGVWFLSLDAASALAVAGARRWFHLPYYRARMGSRVGAAGVSYQSRRTHRGASPASFSARYRPCGGPFEARAGTLEHFLTERYCLFTRDPRGRILRADIHHGPWQLQPAEGEVDARDMLPPGELALPAEAPRLHYARRQECVAWSPREDAPGS